MIDSLVQRLRGQYAMGPHTPNGRPEFGFRQFEAPPIQHEAAARIEELEARLADAVTREEADAMVAAAFEIAARSWPGLTCDCMNPAVCSSPCALIHALTPSDARAALDKIVAEARLNAF